MSKLIGGLMEKEPGESTNFTAKEIGFLISMIEEMAISGKVLELAYTTKSKLRAKLNEIANKEMEF